MLGGVSAFGEDEVFRRIMAGIAVVGSTAYLVSSVYYL